MFWASRVPSSPSWLPGFVLPSWTCLLHHTIVYRLHHLLGVTIFQSAYSCACMFPRVFGGCVRVDRTWVRTFWPSDAYSVFVNLSPQSDSGSGFRCERISDQENRNSVSIKSYRWTNLIISTDQFGDCFFSARAADTFVTLDHQTDYLDHPQTKHWFLSDESRIRITEHKSSWLSVPTECENPIR